VTEIKEEEIENPLALELLEFRIDKADMVNLIVTQTESLWLEERKTLLDQRDTLTLKYAELCKERIRITNDFKPEEKEMVLFENMASTLNTNFTALFDPKDDLPPKYKVDFLPRTTYDVPTHIGYGRESVPDSVLGGISYIIKLSDTSRLILEKSYPPVELPELTECIKELNKLNVEHKQLDGKIQSIGHKLNPDQLKRYERQVRAQLTEVVLRKSDAGKKLTSMLRMVNKNTIQALEGQK
jgi:hypothetical protein